MNKLDLVTGANGHLGNNLVRALLARDVVDQQRDPRELHIHSATGAVSLSPGAHLHLR